MGENNKRAKINEMENAYKMQRISVCNKIAKPLLILKKKGRRNKKN